MIFYTITDQIRFMRCSIENLHFIYDSTVATCEKAMIPGLDLKAGYTRHFQRRDWQMACKYVYKTMFCCNIGDSFPRILTGQTSLLKCTAKRSWCDNVVRNECTRWCNSCLQRHSRWEVFLNTWKSLKVYTSLNSTFRSYK